MRIRMNESFWNPYNTSADVDYDRWNDFVKEFKRCYGPNVDINYTMEDYIESVISHTFGYSVKWNTETDEVISEYDDGLDETDWDISEDEEYIDDNYYHKFNSLDEFLSDESYGGVKLIGKYL